MKNKYLTSDKILKTGLILICISFLALVVFRNHRIAENRSSDFSLLFFINYGIAIAYLLVFLIYNLSKVKWRLGKFNRNQFICSMVLFSISCFSLNPNIGIFSKFSNWVILYLILAHVALLTTIFFPKLIKTLKIPVFFFLGSSVIILLYFTIYLLPFMPFGLLGAFFFGLSLHLIIPLVLLILVVIQYFKYKEEAIEKVAFSVGIILPLMVLGVFIIKWNLTNNRIKTAIRTTILDKQNDLPGWVLVAQKLPTNVFTEKIIASDIAYDPANGFWSFDGLGNTSFSESRKHDPLVIMGMLTSGRLDLSRTDRIKILECLFNKRHLAHRKLWSGDRLATSDIITNIKVYPGYRLAYLEKIITIKNNGDIGRFMNQQEALYTFHLPEGAVVSSLSLWINGKEEPSRLTTREKADNAYVTIVGREWRDPALLHWQEGNRVTATIFPCTPEEPRIFKVGITIPLKKRDKVLELKNIPFEGPDFSNSTELTRLQFMSAISPEEIEKPTFLKRTSQKIYEYKGKYNSDWKINFKIPPLAKTSFSFNGHSYSLSEHTPLYQKANFEKIYLDINKSWNKNEVDAIWKIIGKKKVYVFNKEIIVLNDGNKDEQLKALRSNNFSLFPVFLIDDTDKALLITKSNNYTPFLSELKETGFVKKMQSYYADSLPKIKMFNLSSEPTGYLKTLKEFNAFDYLVGDINKLEEIINKNIFDVSTNSMNNILVGEAGMRIKRTEDTGIKSKAPDHIMRLFAFNRIMHNMGKGYLADFNYFTKEQIEMANEAFVVSPVSSLIVLESVKDYDRFEIKENKNSLKNAAKSSSGAAPEPHEWTLIVLTLLTLTWVSVKKR